MPCTQNERWIFLIRAVQVKHESSDNSYNLYIVDVQQPVLGTKLTSFEHFPNEINGVKNTGKVDN